MKIYSINPKEDKKIKGELRAYETNRNKWQDGRSKLNYISYHIKWKC